jgi:hypothetical protein
MWRVRSRVSNLTPFGHYHPHIFRLPSDCAVVIVVVYLPRTSKKVEMKVKREGKNGSTAQLDSVSQKGYVSNSLEGGRWFLYVLTYPK